MVRQACPELDEGLTRNGIIYAVMRDNIFMLRGPSREGWQIPAQEGLRMTYRESRPKNYPAKGLDKPRKKW